MASSGGYLYAFRIVGTNLVKVGYTRGTLLGRLGAVQHGQPHTLEIAASLYVTSRLRQCEQALHTFLAPHHHRREWFILEITPASFLALARATTAQWADVAVLPDAPTPPPYESPLFDADFDVGPFEDLPLEHPPLVYTSPMADDLV